ncbi:MAG: HAD-IIA family hydrolase [Chloroflexi bacterium]|nr:HAD-IIA family hydrolase [Chloroflexota bacterium]
MTPNSPSLGALEALIVDIDGVLWHGRESLPGVPQFFEFLQSRAMRFVIATNNSARPASAIVERAARLGIQITEQHVLTSAEATALYMPRVAPRGARVCLVGGDGIAHALTREGYQLVERDADVVVVGLDPDLTYEKLKRAALEIRRGATFVGTNADKTFPGDEGLAPGAGAIIAAIQTATDVEPIVIGKPQRAIFDLALERMGADRAATAMLGDRLDTDVEGAKRAGLKSILVMTGITTPELLAQSSIQPDWVFENLDALREAWQNQSRTY